ncbi:MAG: DUF6268 family outer membrane beta-barrel protein [Lacunisphaera sp.]|nr:DUF6268 family outer membrane beta-barrel protein [Lacunisphaera sp.]
MNPRLPFLALAITAALPLAAQNPTSSEHVKSGRPATSLVTLKFDTAYTARTPFTARNAPAGGFSVAQAGAEIAVPLPPLGSDIFPIVSLEYRLYSLDRDAGTPLPDRLQSLSTAFTVFTKLNADWSLLASVSPGFHNAGSTFSSKGFGVGVIAIASRKFNPAFDAGFGFVYDSLSKGSGRIMPVATLNWTPAPAWRVTLGFPRTGVIYTASKTLEVEFTAEADFGSFYVQDDPLPGGSNKPALNRTRLEYQALRVGPALTWQASPTFSARASVGAVPFLRADYHQRNYRAAADRAAAYVSASLNWKF